MLLLHLRISCTWNRTSRILRYLPRVFPVNFPSLRNRFRFELCEGTVSCCGLTSCSWEKYGKIMFVKCVPSCYVKIAIENGHLLWIYPWKMVIFHSYVSLPVCNHSITSKKPIYSQHQSTQLNFQISQWNIPQLSFCTVQYYCDYPCRQKRCSPIVVWWFLTP